MPQAAWLPVDAEIMAALDDVATRLGRLGAKSVENQPEDFDFRAHQEVYASLLNVFIFADMEENRRARIAENIRLSSDLFGQAQALGMTATASQFLDLHMQRELYRACFRDFFREWDVLLSPVTITPAFKHIINEVPFRIRTLQINDEVVPYARLQVYPGLDTLSGQPATAFPWGRTRNGLPIGLQAIGPYLEDRTPITFASLLEREFGGFVPPAMTHF